MHEALTLARKRTSALYVSFQKVFLLLSLFELVLLWRVALKGCFRGLHDFKFLKAVLVCGKDYDRIDVAFDRYRETSIKCATRKKRSRGHAPIRRVIEDGTVPLPRSWSTFLALDENKADLARFLSEKLLAGAPVNKIIIVSGGFQDEDTVKCSRPNIDVRALRGFHDEADTRIILQTSQSCHLGLHLLDFLIASGDEQMLSRQFSCYAQQRKTRYHSLLSHEKEGWFLF